MSTTPEQNPTATDEAADPLLDAGATLADLYARLEATPHRPGTVVTAAVTAVGADAVTVRLGDLEARVPAAEFDEAPAVGAEVGLYVLRLSAEGPVLSRERAARLALFDRLQAAAERDEPVEGRVLARVNGGLSVDVGLKALLPDRRGKANIGEAGLFWVRSWDERKDVFVLAREARSARDARKAAKAEAATDAPAAPVVLPAEGDVVTGTVARLAEFGAFVDLPGGATGLLHATEMSWGRVASPAAVVAVGDEVTVKVVKVQTGGEGKKKGDRVSLSMRALQPEPWTTVAGRIEVGQRVAGPVISLADYGAFVEVEPGIEGLVHVSELGWGPAPSHPREVLQVGERVEAEVVLVDPDKKHLKLSVKRLQPSPWVLLREKFPVGTQVRGKVKNIAPFGVFVTLDEAHRLDGLVHVSDVSWEPVGRLSDKFTPGQEVEVLVLGIDEERGRCSLGMRQLLPPPEQPSLETYAPGQVHEAKVARVKDFGAFVELAPGVEGLLHVSEMGLPEGTRPRQRFRGGQPVSVRILSVDTESRRIALALVSEPALATPESAAPPEPAPEPEG